MAAPCLQLGQVVYYGLSAAGVLCLTLLRPSFSFSEAQIDASHVLRDLSVFTAVLEQGSLVSSDDANYALLAGATEAIKIVLNRRETHNHHITGNSLQETEEASNLCSTASVGDSWDPWQFNYFHDLQNPFWQSIADGDFDLDSVLEVLPDNGT